jgi:hypothetical protein
MPSSGWLRQYATSRKIAGTIPDVVIHFFHFILPSGSTRRGDYIACNRTEYQKQRNHEERSLLECGAIWVYN